MKGEELNGYERAMPLEKATATAPTDAAAVKKWPTLCSCLFPIWREGKCRRQSGSLRLRLVGGYYLLTLSCPTEGVETTLTTDTLVDLFDQFERVLVSQAAVWIPDFKSVKKTRQVRIDDVKSS